MRNCEKTTDGSLLNSGKSTMVTFREITRRYYRSYYACMSGWLLQSQHYCSSETVSVILDAVLRFTVPFTTKYYCPISAVGTSCPFHGRIAGNICLRASKTYRAFFTTT